MQLRTMVCLYQQLRPGYTGQALQRHRYRIEQPDLRRSRREVVERLLTRGPQETRRRCHRSRSCGHKCMMGGWRHARRVAFAELRFGKLRVVVSRECSEQWVVWKSR